MDRKNTAQPVKKRPIFGIEDINIALESSIKKKIENAGLFMCTSSNSMLSNTFYSSTKKKIDVARINSPRQRIRMIKERCRKNDMEP